MIDVKERQKHKDALDTYQGQWGELWITWYSMTFIEDADTYDTEEQAQANIDEIMSHYPRGSVEFSNGVRRPLMDMVTAMPIPVKK